METMLGFFKFRNNNNKQFHKPSKITVEPGWREGGLESWRGVPDQARLRTPHGSNSSFGESKKKIEDK